MIRITNICLSLDFDFSSLKEVAARQLNINSSKIKEVHLYKKSVDARKKDNIKFNCSINVIVNDNEKNVVKLCGNKNASIIKPYHYNISSCKKLKSRPVVVGFGPAGMFASLILAKYGQKPIVIERGKSIDKRIIDVNKFFKYGILNPESNVQFGEGGAGTFSDGKLTTGIKDPRIEQVLKELVLCGAPEEILYLSKPHIGTDHLAKIVENMRNKIISLGGEVLFETKLIDILSENNSINSIIVESLHGKHEIVTDNVILCVGHSARDTFKMLFNRGVQISQKSFSVGVRIEHPQNLIDKAQYGKFAGHIALGAADYKLAVHLNSGRGVYTFCMCPGGTVVAAASELGHVVTNGMSKFSRAEPNANSALLVNVGPGDFGSDHPLAGLEFQRKIEKAAFNLGGQNYYAPIQLVKDFLVNKVSNKLGSVTPSYKPGYKLCNISECFPQFIISSLKEGIIKLDKKLHGFSFGDAILTAPETRSSSPIRITRDETMQSINFKGLYPCSEGAGYSGGIVSAAVDGIRCAEAVLN